MLTVRPMFFQDIDEVYQIELRAHRAPWSREILRDCVRVGYDARILEQTNGDEKQVVGYLIARRNVTTYHILNLCIATPFQHRGFGKFLLKTVLDPLEKENIDTVILEVRPTNHVAIALYEGFGFERDAIKIGYYRDKGGEEDALLLKKNLTKFS